MKDWNPFDPKQTTIAVRTQLVYDKGIKMSKKFSFKSYQTMASDTIFNSHWVEEKGLSPLGNIFD